MNYPELFIFDMDGLIFDSERIFMLILSDVMKEYNYTLTEEVYLRILGISRVDSLKILKEIYGEDYPGWEISGAARQRLNEYAKEHAMPEKKGIRDLLAHLQDQGIPCCVASSSPFKTVELYLEKSGLRNYFQLIQSGDDLEHSKPNPEVFLKCLSHFDVSPERTLVLEDSEAGIQAAVNGGIPVICIPDMKVPAEDLACKCVLVARDAYEVKELLQ